MKILVIIPAYNEEGNILNTISDLKKYQPEIDKIVINDSSIDNTKELLIKENIDYIDLPINLGIGGGVQTGYLYAYYNGYDIAIQVDGDGQHCASEIQKLIDPIVRGEADITIGSRFITKEGFQSSFARRLGISFLSRLILCLTHKRVYDVTSGFRAVNRKYIELFSKEYAQDYPEPESIVVAAKNGAAIKEVPVIMRERSSGTSSISSFKSLLYMAKVTLAIVVQCIGYTGGKS